MRESSFHFISPIIPPVVRSQLSDEWHKSLLYKHLQSFKKWGCTATPWWQDFEWKSAVLGRISLDRSENMHLMGRCVTSFHLKALPVSSCKEMQLCGSDGENKTKSWWRRKGFHIPSPYLKRLMKCLKSSLQRDCKSDGTGFETPARGLSGLIWAPSDNTYFQWQD